MKLELRQEQRLSQRQIQSLHLLQMGWMELENTLSQLAEENPLIDLDASHFYHADVSPSAAYPGSTYRPPLEDEAPSPIDLASTDGGLHETLPRHLQRQIAALPISKEKKQVLFYLSECLDDDGYLRATTEELAEDTGLAPLLLRRCMNALQALEPAGVGAQSLKQCLRLQLERTGSDETALRIVQDFLPSLAKGRYRQIAEAIGVPEKEVRRASDAIRQLEPRPGLAFCRPERSPTIRPDIYIMDRGGTFVCDEDRLYRPTVHVNVYYRKLYLTTENAELKQYLKEKLRHAESILYALEQRGSTLLLCARYIAAQQQEYFRRGPSFLTPMTMTSAASALGVSPSTISRAVRDKYLQSPQGIYPLSHFFSSSAADKCAYSSNAARALLCRLIEQEDKHHPLSDQKLCQMLVQEGFPVSRRTAAKYRGELQIPGASGRRAP